MADRNWGLIRNGATFEALATTLVYFEDQGARLFRRRGRDGGQDVRSGDDRTVYQAKHHVNESSALAIADAKSEATKIAKFRDPGHARSEQWKGVERWCLITNATFNPTDLEKWRREVAPLFKKLGMEATYWGQAHLENLLVKHPEVAQSFFQGELRAFLTIPEVREGLPRSEPFLVRDELAKFVGREEESLAVQRFLEEDSLFEVIHGPGGIGKTRFLVHLGEAIAEQGVWHVLWANVATMETSGAWFRGIVPERPTVLFVDDPDDATLLRVLAEQLGGRARQWKIIIAVRSPKDPVLAFLGQPRVRRRVSQLQLSVLNDDAAKTLCSDLLSSGPLAGTLAGRREAVAQELVTRFSAHPVWLTLAVHVLETTGDLKIVPTTAEALADCYLDEVTGQQTATEPEKLLELLRWVALFGAANREDDTIVQILAMESGLDDPPRTKTILARQVERRVLSERGARSRFVEVKPDVIRDRLLIQWLVLPGHGSETGHQPSTVATGLLERAAKAVHGGDVRAVHRAILSSVARTELILRVGGSDALDIMHPFFEQMSDAIPTLSASRRILLAEVLTDVASFRPSDTANICSTLRREDVGDEEVDELLRRRMVGKRDVILELAWPLFHAAMGARDAPAREQVFGELFALCVDETSGTDPLPNDGRRAGRLLVRVLEGGPHFLSEYDDVAEALANRELDLACRAEPSPARSAALKLVLEFLTSVERSQTWTEKWTLRIQRSVIGPSHPGWQARERALERIHQALLAEDTPRASRILFWKIVTHAHRNLNRARKSNAEAVAPSLRDQLLSELNRAAAILLVRQLEIEELVAARELWDWHVHFEEDGELKSAAEQLETLYSKHDLAAEFGWLRDSDWERGEQAALRKARELSDSPAGEVVAYVERAAEFLGPENDLMRLYPLAQALGEAAPSKRNLQLFVLSILGRTATSAQTEVGVVAAGSWVRVVRATQPTDAPEALRNLVGACGNDVHKVLLLTRVYGAPRPHKSQRFVAEDYMLVRSSVDLFIKTNRVRAFVACVAWSFQFDWEGLKKVLDAALAAPDEHARDYCIGTLVETVNWGLEEHTDGTYPPDLQDWLFATLMRLTTLSTLDGNLGWYVDQVVKKLGRLPHAWLPPALALRRDTAVENPGIEALCHNVSFSRFVHRLEGSDQESLDTLTRLLELASDTGTVGYYLYVVLRDMDPAGTLVAPAVARQLERTSEFEQFYRLARIGGAYGIGSSPWRRIAEPVLERARLLTGDDAGSLYGALTSHSSQVWSSTPGQVAPHFVEKVKAARESLANEHDERFRPFWEWRLSVAKAELRREEELAREERGE